MKPLPDETSADTPLAAPEGTLALGPGRGASQPPPPSDDADPWIGRILGGRYAVESVLGRGGMGVVYEARHVSLQRKVAVKVLRPDLSRDPEALRRFEREALAAAAIGNAHIVDVIDFGYGAEGEAYLVMERLEGEALSALLRREAPLPEGRALNILRQVAEALGAAHGKGIVHRDLKSDNVFLVRRDGQDFVKVVDFGISKVHEDADGRAPITRDGVILGTPRYMAPEQCTDGAEADHRVDLYALGCILFEMLTGTVPFVGRTAVEVLYKQVHADPPRLRALRPGAMPELEAAVERLLAKSPADRFPDAEALLAALPEPAPPSVPSGPESLSTTLPPPSASPPAVARWRARVIAAALVASGALVTEAVWRNTLPSRIRAQAPAAVSPPAGRPSPSPGPAPGPSPPSRPALAPAVPAPAPPVPAPAGPVPVTPATPGLCGLTVVVWPASATFTADGAPCGRGRCAVTRPCGDEVVLTAQSPGYVSQRAAWTLTGSRRRAVWRLLRAPRAGTGGPARGGVVETPPSPPTPPTPSGPTETVPTPRVGPDGLRVSPYRLP